MESAPVVLRPGDAVRISVWRKPELSGEFVVASDGSVADPFYSAVRVADVPFSTADARIKEYVATIEASPRVLVEPLFRVTVGGEVRQPSMYTLRRETSVAQAVAQAGGVTPNGKMENVRLTRGGEIYRVDLSDPASPLAHSPVQSGDEIMVSRQYNLFREYIAPSASILAAAGVILNLILK